MKKKYYFTDNFVDKGEVNKVNLLYAEAVYNIQSENYPITFDEACQLAAIRQQATHGDYQSKIHKDASRGFWKFDGPDAILPKTHLVNKKKVPHDIPVLIEKIGKLWQQQKGSDANSAKYRFLQLCRSLPTYGNVMFPVTLDPIRYHLKPDKKSKKTGEKPFELGINKDGILVFDTGTRLVVKKYPFFEIKAWKLDADNVDANGRAYLGLRINADGGDDIVEMRSSEAAMIAEMIAGYIDILFKRQRGTFSRLNFQLRA